ncbi:MAG: PAS domain-containing protein [Methylococcaceae bacterium]
MSDLIKQGLEQALQVCAAEPIHQINNIQPHGAALVLSADSLRTVLQASANIDRFMDLPAGGVLGKSLVEVMGEASALQVEQLFQNAQAHKTATGLVSASHQQMLVELDAYLYSANEFWVLELCQDSGLPKREQLGELLMRMQDSLLAIETDTTHYFEQVARLVHKLTGYDSVMVYRFEANWDGEVIAQSRVEAATSYLGMRFPASDIPAQARELYTKNRIRVLTDVGAKAVPIMPLLNPVTQQPLDMTYSALRSLSPVHLEYLGNMGVQASMSISLLQNGQLWGLIACHHLTPKRVSFATREAAVFISRMISTEITTIETTKERVLLDKMVRIKTKLLKAIVIHSEATVLSGLSADLLGIVDASGLIVVVEGNRYVQGQVPEPAAVDALLGWLGKQSITDVFSCDHLAEQFAPARAYPEIVSGVIATLFSGYMRNCVVWLRKEKLRTVKWAGSYEQGLVQTPAGDFRLSPRNSFESWSELWRGRSAPWSLFEINIVKSFGQSLSEGLAQKYHARLAENERVELLGRLQKIASRLPGVVYQFRLNPDGRPSFPYVSEGIRDIYRLSPEELREDASKVFTLLYPEDINDVWNSIKLSAQNLTPWQQEYRVQFDDGTINWRLGNAIPEQEADGSVLWHGFTADISERKQAEDQLRLSNVALKEISQGVLITRADQSILWVNEAFESITGYSQAEILEQNCRFIQGPLTDPKTVIEIREALKNLTAFSGEILNYRKDGTLFWNELTISPVLDGQGRLVNFISTTRDISERKLQEQKDREHLNQLAHVTRLGLMGEMASGIAHEVNQPLTAIATYAQVSLNLMKADCPDFAKLADVACKTQQQALRAGEIIRRMRDFVKSNTRQVSAADLNGLIQEAANLCRPELNLDNIELTLQLQGSLPYVNVDTIQIEQVIINLIRNSADALASCFENRHREISVHSLLTLNGGVEVSIKDNGPGIPEDLQQQILMPFYTTKAEGMGMGLSICNSIIEAHQGKLNFNSQAGKGTSFYFTLPISGINN